MRLLVTGGLGFIGSNFIRYMLNKYEDLEVYNVDKMSYGSNLENLRDFHDDPRYHFFKGDICNRDLMNNLIDDVDVIVNFAAESHVDRSISDPLSFFKSNTEGVLIMLELLRTRDKDVRFIQVGTDESYGEIFEGSFKEGDPLNPSSPYAASKASADLFILAYHRTYGLDVVITRCTNNFGPYQFPEKLIPKTIIRALKGLKVPIYGKGENVRDWLYVIDHCHALDLVIHKGGRGEIYNISSGNELRNIDLVKKILDIMDKPHDLIMFVEDRPGHDFRYSLDSSKIRKSLGWKPRYTLDEALEYTVKWYVENGWWWKPLATEKVLHPTPWKLSW